MNIDTRNDKLTENYIEMNKSKNGVSNNNKSQLGTSKYKNIRQKQIKPTATMSHIKLGVIEN